MRTIRFYIASAWFNRQWRRYSCYQEIQQHTHILILRHIIKSTVSGHKNTSRRVNVDQHLLTSFQSNCLKGICRK